MMRAARFAAQLGVRGGPRGRAGDDASGASDPRDRLGGAGPRRADQAAAVAQPRAGAWRCWSSTGLADVVLPELPALQLEVDEHHRHKDVYEHSLTVLEQAIALEGPPDGPEESVPGPGPGAAPRRAAARHRQAGDPPVRAGRRGVSFHHHEVVGAKLAAKRLKALRYRQGHDQGGRPAGRAAPAVPRVRHGRVDRLGGAPLRHRRRPAAAAAAPADPLGLAPPGTSARPSGCRARYDDLEARIERLLEQEELAAVRPELDGNEIVEILGIPPGPVVGPGLQVPARRCGSTRGRSARTRPGSGCSSGGRHSPSRRPSRRPSPPARPTCRPRLADPSASSTSRGFLRYDPMWKAVRSGGHGECSPCRGGRVLSSLGQVEQPPAHRALSARGSGRKP